jgi:hypothetical protein
MNKTLMEEGVATPIRICRRKPFIGSPHHMVNANASVRQKKQSAKPGYAAFFHLVQSYSLGRRTTAQKKQR